MAIALRASPTSVSRTTAGTLTVTPTAGTAAGDVLLVTVDVSGGGNVPATPAGLTKLDSGSSGPSMVTFYRVCDGTETTFAVTVAAAACATARSYTGVDNTNPINAHGVLNRLAPSASCTGTTITTTVDGCMIVFNGGGAVNSASFTNPASFANQKLVSASTVACAVTCDWTQVTQGATGSITGTLASSMNNYGGLIALAPFGAGGNATGSLPTLTESTPAGSALGDGVAAGAPGTLALTAPSGAALGAAATTGALPTQALTAPAAAATGGASAAGNLAVLTLVAIAGTAVSAVVAIAGRVTGGLIVGSRATAGRVSRGVAGRIPRRTP